MSADPDLAAQFRELCRDVERATYGTVLLADCEPQFSRALEFVRAHPEARDLLAEAFRQMLSSYITRFCMQHLQWPEIAVAARERMKEEIHNSEYATLQKLLGVYPTQTN